MCRSAEALRQDAEGRQDGARGSVRTSREAGRDRRTQGPAVQGKESMWWGQDGTQQDSEPGRAVDPSMSQTDPLATVWGADWVRGTRGGRDTS